MDAVESSVENKRLPRAQGNDASAGRMTHTNSSSWCDPLRRDFTSEIDSTWTALDRELFAVGALDLDWGLNGWSIEVIHDVLVGEDALPFLTAGPVSVIAEVSPSSKGTRFISLEHRMYPATWKPLAS